MILDRRLRAALAALLLTFFGTVAAYGTVDRAICTTADAGAACTGAEVITSTNEEIVGLDNRAPMNLGSVAGTNTVTASVTPTLTALADRQGYWFKPVNDNTGAVTLAINSIAAKAVVSSSGTALGSGDLLATNIYLVVYHAASDHFRVITTLGAGTAAASNAYVTIGNTASLTAERALTAGTAIGVTDAGVNSTVTIAVNDVELTSIAGLTSAADKIPYYTGLGTAAVADFSAAIRTIITTPSSANLAAWLSDETGSGPAVFATSPTLATPVLGVASATSINKVAITAPATAATITIPDGVTLTGPAASGTAMTLGNTETVTGVKTFGAAAAVGRLRVAGTTSGSTIIDATAAASGTLTLPAATDTLVGQATTDTLTNKTFDTAGVGNSLSINSLAATANTGTGAVVRASTPTLVTPVLGVATATTINGATITSGTLNGSVTGTNTGDQTITLTGDVTGTGTGSFAATVAADSVALTTDTTGNYQSGNTAGTGIAVTQTPAEGFSSTVAFDFTDAGADPALGAAECRFSNEGASAAGIVCEGDTADTFETRIRLTDPTADRLMTIPNADSNSVQPLTCGGTDKVSAISAAGVVTCTADSGAAGGDSVTVNGVAAADVDLDDATPAAVSGANVLWQKDAGAPNNVSAYVPASSVTVIGAVELATTAEAAAQADTVRAITAQGLAFKPEAFCIAASDETTAITTGTAKTTFRMPYAFTLTNIRGSLNTVSSSGSPIIDVNEAGTSVMTTNKVLIDVSELTSVTAVTAVTLTDTALADDALMTIDFDVAGTGAKGAKICLIGHQ